MCVFSVWPLNNYSLILLCSWSVQAIRVFFMLRSLSLQLRGEPETQLPLTREEDLIKTDDVLDLSKSWEGRRGGGGEGCTCRHASSGVTGRVGVRPELLPRLICHQKLTVCAHRAKFKEGALDAGCLAVCLRALLSGAQVELCRVIGVSSSPALHITVA